MWHLEFVENLSNMGFTPWEVDHDLCMWNRGYHCEYVVVMADYLLVFSQYPNMITTQGNKPMLIKSIRSYRIL